MSSDPSDDLDSSAELRLIDAVCDAFERDLAAGQNPSIESYIGKHPDLDPKVLRYELVKAECHHRKAIGENPDLAAYSQRYLLETEEIEKIKSDLRRKSAAPTKAIDDSTENDPDGEFELTADDTATGEATIAMLERRGFRDIRRIGRGAYGEVDRAYDPQRECDVAIKTPTLKTLASPKARQRFLKEAEIGKQFDHPNVVKTLGVESFEGHDLIIQRFIDGQNLEQWFDAFRKRDEFPEPETVVELLLPVARALAHVHQRGYSHQDLKPENILIDHAGNVFVTDFGLTIHESEQRSWRGSRAGTMPYMSPEQIRWQTHLIDGRSDIWSFGVILYRLLAGKFPFGGPPPKSKSEQERYCEDLEKEITEIDPRPIRQERTGLSRQLTSICNKCLAKSPKDRYENGDDLAEDLLLFLDKRWASVPSATPRRPIKIVPKGLRSFDAGDSDFFLELLPGPRHSDGVPESIRFLENRLQGADGNEPLDLGIIFGPSGSGKSSLVKAGLIPRLQNKNYETLFVEATAEDTEVRLLNGLRGKLKGPSDPESMELDDAFRLVARRYKANGRKLLVVIDQFEQWLAVNTHFAANQLVDTFRECNGVGIQVLILTREDFWWRLNEFTSAIELTLSERSNYLRVELFDRDHAKRILMAFGEAYGKLPPAERIRVDQEEFLEKSLDDLADQNEYVPVRLALFAEMMSDRPWTMEELKRIGGAKGVGVAFLESRFGRNAPIEMKPYVEIAPRLLEAMLPPLGSDIKGQMLSVAELGDSTKAEPKKLASLLQLMEGDMKLLTKVDADQPEGAVPSTEKNEPTRLTKYQLTHDYLVGSIRQWLDERSRGSRNGRAKLMLRTQTELWNRLNRSTRYLPTSMEWLGIRLRTNKSEWTPMQAAMMHDAARRVAMRSFGTLATIALMAITGWGFYNYVQKSNTLENQIENFLTPSITSDEQVLDEVNKLVATQDYLGIDTKGILSRFENTHDTHGKTRQALLLARLGSLEHGPIAFLQQQLTAPTTSAAMWHAIQDALARLNLIPINQLLARLATPKKPTSAELVRIVASLVSQKGFVALPQSDDLCKDLASAIISEPATAALIWARAFGKIPDQLANELYSLFEQEDQRELSKAQAYQASALLSEAKLIELITEPKINAEEMRGIVTKLEQDSPRSLKAISAEFADVSNKTLDTEDRNGVNSRERPLKLARLATAASQLKDYSLLRRVGGRTEDLYVRALAIAHLNRNWASFEDLLSLVIDTDDDDPLLPVVLLATWDHIDSAMVTMPQDMKKVLESRLASLASGHPSAEVHSVALGMWRKVSGKKSEEPIGTDKTTEDRRKSEWFKSEVTGLTMVRLSMPTTEGKVRQFSISSTEVTQQLFEKYKVLLDNNINRGPSRPVNNRKPIEILRFLNWLSQSEGIPETEHCYEILENQRDTDTEVSVRVKAFNRRGYRLPTVSEWQFAAGINSRVENPNSMSFHFEANLIDQYAWSFETAQTKTRDVGSLLPLPNGLFDLWGNVSELVLDSINHTDDDIYKNMTLKRCGGSAYFKKNWAMMSSVEPVEQEDPDVSLGFRIVQTLGEAK